MQIKVVNVGEAEMVKGPKARYETFVLKYTADGKARERKLMSFSKDIYPILKAANSGDEFEIDLKKEGEFWNWVGVTPVAGGSKNETTAKASSKGSWETAEERATRQLYIIRQNALTNAVAFAKDQHSVEHVLETAQKFADWVTDFENELDLDDTPDVS